MLVSAEEHFCAIARGGREKDTEFALAQDGRWSAAEVFRACSRVHGRRIPRHMAPRGVSLDRSFHNLKEDLIAEVIAADGIAPYRHGQRSVALEALLRSAETRKLGSGDRPQVRRAVQAVADAGLAVLTKGPKGGFANADLMWDLRARRGEVTRLADPESDAALSALVGR
jgi:hypothetical protein